MSNIQNNCPLLCINSNNHPPYYSRKYGRLIFNFLCLQTLILFMLQSTHKMANLTQNEIRAVLCSKRQYKQHDGEKMAMWNSAHRRFIKLWKSNTNTTETFIKHVLPAKVRAINRLKNTNHRTRKRQEWGGGGLRKNFCVSTRSRTRHPLYDDQ